MNWVGFTRYKREGKQTKLQTYTHKAQIFASNS